MWAHYSEWHTGLVLEFNVEIDSAPFGSSKLASAEAVSYEEDYPAVSMYADEEEWSRALLMTKSKQWAYEDEYRCIDPGGPGLRHFEQAELAAVTLGCRASDEDQSDVGSWCQQRAVPAVYRCVTAERRFELTRIRIG